MAKRPGAGRTIPPMPIRLGPVRENGFREQFQSLFPQMPAPEDSCHQSSNVHAHKTIHCRELLAGELRASVLTASKK